MFQGTIGPGSDLIYEPIKYLRRGVEIQMIAPKVSPHHAAHALTAIGCTELVELSAYLRGHDEASDIQYVPLFNTLLTCSLHC